MNLKTEKFKQFLKNYNIINFETIRNEITASSNLNPWILNYNLLRSVSILRLPKDF